MSSFPTFDDFSSDRRTRASPFEFFKINQRSDSPSTTTSSNNNNNNQDMLFESPFSSFSSPFDPFDQHRSMAQEAFGGAEIPIRISKSSSNSSQPSGSDQPRSRTNSNTMSSGEHSQPKVHHIPIHIEGRNSPASRTSRTPTPTRASPNVETRRATPETRFSSSPPKGPFVERMPQAPHVKQIPIVRDFKTRPEDVRTATPGGSFSKGRTSDETITTEDGPFVTRIPINIVNKNKSLYDEQVESHDDSPKHSPTPPKVIKTPMQEVEEIKSELDSLQEQIDSFDGESSDKQYRYLDEMLTRLLIKLDNVEVNGNEDVRSARKQVISAVQAAASLLESKGKKQPDSQPAEPEVSPMEEQSMEKVEEKEESTTNIETGDSKEEVQEEPKEEIEEVPSDVAMTEEVVSEGEKATDPDDSQGMPMETIEETSEVTEGRTNESVTEEKVEQDQVADK